MHDGGSEYIIASSILHALCAHDVSACTHDAPLTASLKVHTAEAITPSKRTDSDRQGPYSNLRACCITAIQQRFNFASYAQYEAKLNRC
jgi:hypothetical protein